MAGRGASSGVGSLRPQLMVLVLVALVPYDGLLLLAPPSAILGAWKELLVLATLARAWQRRDHVVGFRAPSWAQPAAALLALALVSAVLHPGVSSVLGLKIGFFYLVTIPLALWLAPLDHRDRDRLVTILMINAIIVSLVGAAQQAVGHQALNELGYEYNEVIRFTKGWLRSFSTFNQPFPFAFFVMTAMLIGVPVALEDRQRLRNRIFLWSLPLLTAGILSSFVRGALLGLGVGFALLGFARYRVLARLLVLLPIGAMLVVVSGGASAVLSTNSLDARMTGWASEVFEQGVEPLGQGIGTTGSAAELIPNDPDVFPTSVRGDRYQPDNYFVKTLIELGPIGAWLFVSILVVVGTNARRLTKADLTPSDRGMAFGIYALVVASVPVGLISSFWEIFPVDLIFWLLVGVITSLEHQYSSTPCSSSQSVAAGASPSIAAI